MKLLFDQNLSPRLIGLVADLFPESNHVFQLGLDLLMIELYATMHSKNTLQL